MRAKGGAWNRDGIIVFGADIAQPLYRILATGAEVLPVTPVSRKGTAQTRTIRTSLDLNEATASN